MSGGRAGTKLVEGPERLLEDRRHEVEVRLDDVADESDALVVASTSSRSSRIGSLRGTPLAAPMAASIVPGAARAGASGTGTLTSPGSGSRYRSRRSTSTSAER